MNFNFNIRFLCECELAINRSPRVFFPSLSQWEYVEIVSQVFTHWMHWNWKTDLTRENNLFLIHHWTPGGRGSTLIKPAPWCHDSKTHKTKNQILSMLTILVHNSNKFGRPHTIIKQNNNWSGSSSEISNRQNQLYWTSNQTRKLMQSYLHTGPAMDYISTDR